MKTDLRFTVVLLLIGLCAAGANAADGKPIAIVHARLIDGMGGTPVEDATVLVRGKTLEYAGAAAGASVPKDAQIIGGAGKTVMPGLADLHVHLQGGWDGRSVDLLGYQRYLNAVRHW